MQTEYRPRRNDLPEDAEYSIEKSKLSVTRKKRASKEALLEERTLIEEGIRFSNDYLIN